jgi:flagellin FlaB
MKANQKFKNDRAEVGVGTLIVFIAMVLVAAVAAAVLINTTGTLQQRAQQTGKEATQEVSSNLKVTNVYGIVDTGKIDELKINIQLAAGASPMDLQELIVRYSDGTNTPVNYVWAAAESVTEFEATWIRGTQGEVMQPGDLVEIHFLITALEELPVRTSVSLNLIPEAGGSVPADFRTPATYGSDTIVTLR